MKGRVLIAGCGDVGAAAGRLLAGDGWAVHGLRRRPGKMPAGVQGVAADLLAPTSLKPLAGDWDRIVYCPTPGERSEAAYRAVFLEGLGNLLAVAGCERLVFVSSTAVYGQCRGEVVDEASATRPAAFNGAVLLEAEARAAAGAPQALALRFGGIYGPGRERLLRMAARGPALEVQREPPHWTNRIHRDDCARSIHWACTAPAPPPVLNGVDREPAPLFEVLAWLAKRLGEAPPAGLRNAEADQGKRVSSALLERCGFALRFPDYRAGYAPLLAARTAGTAASNGGSGAERRTW